MPASLDCVICLMKQSLDAARFATSDEKIHREILERTTRMMNDVGITTDPPVLGTKIHRVVRDVLGNPDPYLREKKACNNAALSQWNRFQRWVSESSDPFETALRLAIAGNSIDFALGPLDSAAIEASISQALTAPLNGSVDELRSAIRDAKTILYLADNAGEIVLDKLLVERLISGEFKKNVTFVTRGFPIINDALLDDAEEVGMTRLVRTISNGSDGLGVHFDSTSAEFNDAFRNADLVLAKGLANFETLVDGKGPIFPKKIAFLLKSKCPFLAKVLDAPLGDLVVRIQ